MSTRQNFKNNVNVALASGINAVAVACTVAAGQGALFGTIAAGEFIRATIKDDLGAFEIVKITAIAVDTLTIVRAEEGTSGHIFDIADNPKISMRVTSDTLQRFAQKAADETITGSWTFSANPVFVGAGGVLGALKVYTTANDGAAAYSKPSGLKFAIVEVQGAGGGGGAGDTADNACGGGGGAGGYAMKKIAAASIGGTENVTVGAGGTAGATVAGGTGGTSSFGALLTATGGTGGSESTSAAATVQGGGGGSGASGDINITGGDGTGGSGPAILVGNGGDSQFGHGGAGTTGTGRDGNGYGGGGSGGRRSGGTNRAGGLGAEGVILVYEYF